MMFDVGRKTIKVSLLDMRFWLTQTSKDFLFWTNIKVTFMRN